jgi:hypothetical protein
MMGCLDSCVVELDIIAIDTDNHRARLNLVRRFLLADYLQQLRLKMLHNQNH